MWGRGGGKPHHFDTLWSYTPYRILPRIFMEMLMSGSSLVARYLNERMDRQIMRTLGESRQGTRERVGGWQRTNFQASPQRLVSPRDARRGACTGRACPV